MGHFLHELNEVQRNACTTTAGPVMVIAGPGSGKTRVLTSRVSHLLESGIQPHEILTLTFTNKAAKEMKERIEKVIGPAALRVWAGTFHSMFAKILRMEASKIGFPPGFTIYDTDDTNSLLKSIIKELHLDANAYPIGAIRSRISLAKSNLISPQIYRTRTEMLEDDRRANKPQLVEIYEKYMDRCKKAGAMDFDDLLFQLYRLFQENPDNVLQKYQKRFQYIHVDEFQDTNFLQYAILKKLIKYEGSPENIFIVGDDAQSIYAFRGATIDNILDFEKDYPNLKIFKLEQNYRSTNQIVSAANQVIAHNKKQLQKTIWTKKDTQNPIRLLKCASDDEEGRRIADLILEQKNRLHLPNNEIAILYRTNAQSRKFEEHLRRINLPYRIFGGMSFFQRKEVKDFTAYLRLAVNPNDEEALKRIINYPTRGISDATLSKLNAEAFAKDTTVWEIMGEPHANINEKALKALSQFKSLISKWNTRNPTDSAYNLASDILRQSGLLDSMKNDTTPDGNNRMENVYAVLDAIAEFSASTDPVADQTLATYLQTISLLTDADDDKKSTDHVTLMSVHSAKGLEFKSVFVTGLEEDLFPSFMSKEEIHGIDEERRLFYVAITRAKEYLTISYAQTRYRFGQIKTAQPSRFLSEVYTQNMGVEPEKGPSRQPLVQPTKAYVQGNFTRPSTQPKQNHEIPAGFIAALPTSVAQGDQVFHQKFGLGQVTKVDGPRDNRVATIVFKTDDLPERRIMLKFAKLMTKQ
jgi:DNA helicase-2/ATP-dependent DNA helicase PcrA